MIVAMPTPHVHSPPPALAPPALPTASAAAAPLDMWHILKMALLLATMASIYLQGGLFVERWPQLGEPLRRFGFFWVAQFVVACAMLVLLAKGFPKVPPQGAHRTGGLSALVLVCAVMGLVLQVLVYFLMFANEEQRTPGDLRYLFFWNLVLASFLTAAHSFAQRGQAASHALHDAEVRRMALARELDTARLQLLQAQVEPHFLFNALANVRRLLRTDAGAASTLLADLLRYLQEALPALRDEHSTLGREAELVRAFLAVHQVRMGARLRTRIHVPPDLVGHSLPPMILLTLVENALKHGLQPRVEGGDVHIHASAAHGLLTLTVADTGQGMGSGSGAGTGLANVRARLKAMYGGAASLSLAVNEPRGVVATVVLPETRA
jgi:signal transduction histidine kinase